MSTASPQHEMLADVSGSQAGILVLSDVRPESQH
ncbi:hypothetical protein ACVWZ4_007423 [Bradyrhizobium sp. USDA 4472]